MTGSDIPDDREATNLSRRHLLAMGSATVAGGLAGCGGDGGGESPTASEIMGDDSPSSPSPTESLGEFMDPRLDNNIGTVPTDIEVGWGGQGNGILNWMTTALGTMRVDGGYEKVAMKDWTLDNKTLTIEIKDGYTYHNGDPLDIQDAITGHQLVYWLDPSSARWSEPPERLGPRRARFIYPEKKAETIIIRYFSQGSTGALPRRFLQKSQAYKDTVTEMREAETSEERDTILEETVKGVLPEHHIDHIVETQRGSGPYMIESMDDVTDQYVHMVRYDDNPDVDPTTFPPEFRLHFTGGQAAREQLITNDIKDFGGGAFPEGLRGSSPDHLETIHVGAKPQGTVVHFNYINKDTGNRNVRRAIYSLLNMPDIMSANNGQVLEHTYQLGMTHDLCDNFLGSDFVSNRIQYPHEADEEAATAYMEQAGYTKDGGTWVDSDGEETDITLVVHTNKALVGESIASPMNDFGLNVEALAEGNPSYNNRVRNEKDYDMALWGPYGDWGGVPHPWYFYRVDKHINLALAGGASGATTWRQATSIDDLEEGTDYIMQNGRPVSRSNEHPIYPRVPQQMGAEEISGSGKEINLLENDNFLVRGDEVQQRAEEGAQYYNFDLPNFMVWERTYGAWGDTQNFEFPGADSGTMKSTKPAKHLIYGGTIKGRRQ